MNRQLLMTKPPYFFQTLHAFVREAQYIARLLNILSNPAGLLIPCQPCSELLNFSQAFQCRYGDCYYLGSTSYQPDAFCHFGHFHHANASTKISCHNLSGPSVPLTTWQWGRPLHSMTVFPSHIIYCNVPRHWRGGDGDLGIQCIYGGVLGMCPAR